MDFNDFVFRITGHKTVHLATSTNVTTFNLPNNLVETHVTF